jgi:hypothetical protein
LLIHVMIGIYNNDYYIFNMFIIQFIKIEKYIT